MSAPTVIGILAPNPGPFTLEGTNTWIVGPPPVLIIDPGPEDLSHLEAVEEKAGRASAILLTHRHADHSAGAARLSAITGAPVLAFRAVPGEVPIRDGDTIRGGGGALVAIHTPGHSTDHVSFHHPEAGLLFTGDAVLGRGTSVIDPPDGDMGAYVRSLARMRDLRARTLYPGHGPAIASGPAKLQEYLHHRQDRERQVLEGLRDGPRTPANLVPTIYADYPASVHPVAERTVLAHLLKLEREGTVIRMGDPAEERFTLRRPAAPHDDGPSDRPAPPEATIQ